MGCSGSGGHVATRAATAAGKTDDAESLALAQTHGNVGPEGNTVDTADDCDAPATVDPFDFSDVDVDAIEKSWRKALYVTDSEADIEDYYKLEDEIGKGSFSSVRRALCKSTGSLAAVKIITKGQVENHRRGLKAIKEELDIMKMLDHPNILKLDEVFEDRHHVYLVLELCVGGTMQRLIEGLVGGLAEEQAACALKQTFSAIGYMHSLLICHRDVKAENIILTPAAPVEKTTFKLADLGIACAFSPGGMITERAGTPAYAAPEVFMGKYNNLCDLWSAGVLMHFMLSRELPFSGEDDAELVRRLVEYPIEFEGRLDHLTGDAQCLVGLLLEVDPQHRCTAAQALDHNWFLILQSGDTLFDTHAGQRVCCWPGGCGST